MSGLVAAIAKADADGDGKVTIEEFEAAFGPSSLDERSLMQMMRTGNLGMSLGDVYLFSRRFIESNGLYDKPFQPVVYLESIAAANLEVRWPSSGSGSIHRPFHGPFHSLFHSSFHNPPFPHPNAPK